MASEKRLIDANALKRQIAEEIHTYWTNGAGGYCLAEDVIPDIDNAPTVDAVEVVHGRWEETLVPDGYVQKASRMRKKCSICGWINACRYNYCPNCGAKMDGDGNG